MMCLDYLNAVCGTPVLQGLVRGFRLEAVPLIQTALCSQEFFEARIGTSAAKELPNCRVSFRQFLSSEAQREICSEIEIKIVFVRYRDVPVRGLKVNRELFVSRAVFRDLVDRTGVQ